MVARDQDIYVTVSGRDYNPARDVFTGRDAYGLPGEREIRPQNIGINSMLTRFGSVAIAILGGSQTYIQVSQGVLRSGAPDAYAILVSVLTTRFYDMCVVHARG